MQCQQKVWFQCWAALLKILPSALSHSQEYFLTISSRGLFAHYVSFIRLLRVDMYVWWCFPQWQSKVSAEILPGKSALLQGSSGRQKDISLQDQLLSMMYDLIKVELFFSVQFSQIWFGISQILILKLHEIWQYCFSISSYKRLGIAQQQNDHIMAQVNVDAIIEKLLSVRGSAKPGKPVNLDEKEITGLLKVLRPLLMSQPALLELSAPVKIAGDIHGQYYDLLRIFSFCGQPPTANYVFLGDYVDRGKQGIETFCLLASYKVKYPQNFFMLRGNHQSEQITKFYGFFDECKRRYSVKLWKCFIDVFNCLPIAALIDDRILCMHGGLSPELSKLENINQIQRPVDIPDTGLLCDLMWSDPKEGIQGWGENERGISYTFGEDVVKFMIEKFKLDLICRAHQVVEDGYEFFAKRQLVTVFSAPNYIGEFDNSGGIMSINESLVCSFQVLKPRDLEGATSSALGRPGTPAPPRNI